MTALGGAIALISLTLLTEAFARKPTREATAHAATRTGVAEACLRNAEVLASMGFASHLEQLWRTSNARVVGSQQRAGDIAGGLGAIARVLRMMLQSSVLAVGAYLVILHQASAGIIIAGSILAARALAPVDVAIANWRSFIAARQSWGRLDYCFASCRGTPSQWHSLRRQASCRSKTWSWCHLERRKSSYARSVLGSTLVKRWRSLARAVPVNPRWLARSWGPGSLRQARYAWMGLLWNNGPLRLSDSISDMSLRMWSSLPVALP